MRKSLLFISFLSAFCALSQNYSGPESVEFDYNNNRWLIGNKNSHEVLARDASGNLSLLIPASSIGNTGPYGIEIVDGVLFTCCGAIVKGFDLTTLDEVFQVNTGATFLNGITHDNQGNLFTTDFTGKVIYKINIANQTSVSVASNLVQSPNGIIFDEANNRCVFVNWGSNAPIKALNLDDNSVSTIITTAYTNCDGIAQDGNGDFYISIWGGQQVVKYDNAFASSPSVVVQSLSSPADIFFNTQDLTLGIPNSGNNTVTFVNFHLNLNEFQQAHFSVYPNPAQNEIILEISEFDSVHQVEIYNVEGKLLHTMITTAEDFESNRLKMNTEKLGSGSYILKIYSKNSVESKVIMLH